MKLFLLAAAIAAALLIAAAHERHSTAVRAVTCMHIQSHEIWIASRCDQALMNWH